MKFHIASKALYAMVSAVSKVINSKNALTILNNFYFEIRDNILMIKASDGDNTLTGRIALLDADGNGAFCVDARRMVDVLKELPDQSIEVMLDEESLEVTVTYRNGVYNTMAISGSEYPAGAPDAAEAESVEFLVPVAQMLQGIESTLFAVGSDDSHPQMMGILWDVKDDKIVFVSTDTRKLVRYSNATAAPGVECSFILPFKPANILKTVYAAQEQVKVTLSPRRATFESADFTFSCQLIKGNYPDYNRVIPTQNPYTLSIDRLAFHAAVRRVNSFVDANNGRVTFKITPERIYMRAQDTSFNTSGEESVECDFSGNDMFIAFSAPYLLEILNVLTTSDIMMQLADQSRAAVIVPSENAENTDLLMLLMPMFVQEF